MIHFKIILLVLLSVLPFLYAWYVKPKRNTSSIWRNLFLVILYIPGFRFACKKIKSFVLKVFQNMKHSDNARKFFSLIVLMFLLFIHFTEMMASTQAARFFYDSMQLSQLSTDTIITYQLMMTPFGIALLSFTSNPQI